MRAFHVKNVTFHEEPEPQAEPVFIDCSKIIKIAFRMTQTRKERKRFYKVMFRKTPMKLRRIKR